MRFRILLAVLLLPQISVAADKIPAGKLLDEMIHRSTLAEPGGKPFYMKATLLDKDGKSEFNGTVEEYWVSPTKWRRIVKLRDFSQTRIVNGDMIYEENNGDYFPLYDEMLVNEIVDPLPKTAVDLINRLEMQATKPGSGEGQCMAEKYFDDEEGQETRVLLAYNCRNGLLIYLWSPTCCYGVMTDYHKFHGKEVAYGTKDDPLNIHIDTLRDLENPDESLFAISQTTAAEKRITTKKVSEKVASKLLADKTEIAWPSGVKKQGSNNIGVYLVIGRDGKVKQSWSYSNVDDAIKDATLEAVKKWTFAPQNVNGVPAQIQTQLTIPLPAEFLAAAATGPQIKPTFDKMRAIGSLRLEGGPSFHMKASFHSEDDAMKGTYEETWMSPKKWRREVKLNDTSVVEVRTEDAFYRTFPGKYAPRLADDVIEALSFNLPGDNGGDLHEPDWSAVNAKLGTVPVLRLSRGYINPQGKADATALQYFIEEDSGRVRGRYHYSTFTIFNDLQPFGEKMIARKLTMSGADVAKMQITIDTLEGADNTSESIFKISGAKPVFTSDTEDQRFTPPHLVYSMKPDLAVRQQNVMCDVTIDEHGHVRDVDVKGTTNEMIIKPLRAALMHWEYEPATFNGHPSLGFTQVKIE